MGASECNLVFADKDVNKTISKEYKKLSDDQKKSLDTIKEFNEDLYNNWKGDAGDEFINAAYTIQAYLINAVYKSDTCGELMNDWSDDFAAAEEQITTKYQDNVMLEGH